MGSSYAVCPVCRRNGILTLHATDIRRTISLPFRENFGRAFADVGHDCAVINLSRFERLSLHMA